MRPEYHETTQEADAMSKTRNPVARHSRKFNKAHVMRDRKKDAKRGYEKHRKAVRKFSSNYSTS